MNVETFVDIIGADFYTGVPDSQLKPLCDYLMHLYGIDQQHHIIAANEGNCTALAAGYHLATGRVPVVYMQNSGEGNIINPVASLLHGEVYAIPMIFVIGWRGEPGKHDEPQHVFQGKVTVKLLDDVGIQSYIVSEDTTETALRCARDSFQEALDQGGNVAFVIQKNALTFEKKIDYHNPHTMLREEIVRHLVAVTGNDPIVSTTGKVSRELFEIREADETGHQYDFLTVGSMGHSSSIALGIALHKPAVKVWCLDGDGAVLMHMGAMAVIGANRTKNLVHVIINNGAHETVGGMPTVAENIDLAAVAKACGYPNAVCVDSFDALDAALRKAKASDQLSLIEVKCAIGARADLGRPTMSTTENRNSFIAYLNSLA